MTKAYTQTRWNWKARTALVAALAALIASALALGPAHAGAFQAECMDWTDCSYVDQGDPDGSGWDTSGAPGDGYGMPSDDGDWEDSASAEDFDSVTDDSDATADDQGWKQKDGSSAKKLGTKDPSDSADQTGMPKPSLENSYADSRSRRPRSDDDLPVCQVWGMGGPCRARKDFLHNPDRAFEGMFGPGSTLTAKKFGEILDGCREVQEESWNLAAVSYISYDLGVTVPGLREGIHRVQTEWFDGWCDFLYMEPPRPGSSDPKPGSGPSDWDPDRGEVALG